MTGQARHVSRLSLTSAETWQEWDRAERARRSEAEQASGYVYVMQAEMRPGELAGPIKIGYSRHPVGRMKDLQTGSPLPLVLAAQIAGPPELEGRLHRKLHDRRLHGEWFDADLLDVDQALIRSVW
jgi:T5orf172 domain